MVHREELQETQQKATVGARGRADILETSRAGKTEINYKGKIYLALFSTKYFFFPFVSAGVYASHTEGEIMT